MKMRLGMAWLILEESFDGNKKHLISIVSAKKSSDYVRNFMEQKYVDTFASFQEKIAFKNNSLDSPFRIEKYAQATTTISCGHEPVYRAYRCHRLRVNGSNLEFSYRVFLGAIGSITEQVYWEVVPIA